MIASSFLSELANAWERSQDTLWPQTWTFLSLTLRALGLALLIGLPLGVLLSRWRKVAAPTVAGLALLQTIPSVVLVGMLIPWLGLGQAAAIFAAVAYSLFPIVLNTSVGIKHVSHTVRDAARGMGMTASQVLWHIELPLALPVILAGVRSAAVYCSAIITFGAFVGAGGLGDYIFTGLSRGDNGLIALGALSILVVTLLLFASLGAIGLLGMRKSGVVLGGALIVALGIYALLALAQPLLETRPGDGQPKIQATAGGTTSFLTEVANAWDRNHATFWRQAWTFLSLTLRGTGLALLIGLPAGILLSRSPRIASPTIGVLALLQTVPSLVLVGLLVSWLDVGQPAALFAAVVYCLFPIIMNTSVGIGQVSPTVRDAASGMGMTATQVLWHIELPLALPVILAGIRSAAVYACAIITVGSLVSARGLGDFVFDGLRRADNGLMWLGALPILALTLALFGILGGIAAVAKKNSSYGFALGGTLIATLSAYAILALAHPSFSPRRADIRIGAKDFVEGSILSELLKQVVEDRTGLEVEIMPNLGTAMILKALKHGQIDAYPEYLGVLWTNQDALGMTVPADASTITDIVRREMQSRFNLELLEPFGLNNTYALCLTRATAKRLGLQKISDLGGQPQLRVVVDLSFLERPDGWKGLAAKYNLKFDQAPQQVAPDLLYRALESNKVDLVIGYATDWQIEALDLVVLDDDRKYFPSYLGAPLAREGVLQRFPGLRSALNSLAAKIDDQTMRRLNFQVAQEKRSESEVARTFLITAGLLSKQ